MAFCNAIISEDLYDHDFVEKWCFGFEQFAERVQTMSVAEAAEICEGLAERRIVEAARLYATAKPAALQWGLVRGREAQRHRDGLLLSGHDGHHGQHRQPGAGDVMGAIDIGGLGSGYTDLDPQSKINEQVGVDEYPAMVRTQQFTHPDVVLDGKLEKEDSLFHMGFFTAQRQRHREPPATCPSAGKRHSPGWKSNVVMDIVMTPTAEGVCDLFVPVNTYAERDMYVAAHGTGACGTWIGRPSRRPSRRARARTYDITIMRELGTRLRPAGLWSGTGPTSSTSTTRRSAP